MEKKSPSTSPHSTPSLEAAVPSPEPRGIKDLPESLLCAVLEQVAVMFGDGFSHALVCRKWAQVSMEAQRRVIVREGAAVAESDLLNELRNFPNLRKLQLEERSVLRLTDRFFLGIGTTCPHLESISILVSSSEMEDEFSTDGLRGMISSLPGLRAIVLRASWDCEWYVPDSVSSLSNLKVLSVGYTTNFQPLRIPPSIRELGYYNDRGSWVEAEEGGELQGLRLLIVEASDVDPEVLPAPCSLRALRMHLLTDCPRLGAYISRLTALRELNLQVKEVTDCFSTLQLLTQLRLTLHNVEALPDSLWSLTSLKDLYLHCRGLRSIDNRVGQLQRLTSLDVSSGQALNFPTSLCGHSALRKLGLDLRQVQPDFELHARSLTDAHITLDEEADISRFLRGCPSLSSLRLRNVKDASGLLGDAGLPPSLQSLRIHGSLDVRLALPDSFGSYSKLETLEIVNGTGLVELPSSIAECGRLTELTVENCIGECGKVTKLTVSGGNNLRSLPPQLGSLGNLHTLCIEDCYELQCLPQSVGQLSSLKVLALEYLHNLRSIPESLGAAHRLCTLKVVHCAKLNCLPESVGQLAMLTNLTVWYCPLVKELLASMSQLLSLRVLELIALPTLQFLPKGVEKITTLHSLTVKQCWSLRKLPSKLGQLKNLRKVFIRDCRTLRQIPPSIGDLVHLKRLHLKSLYCLSAIPKQIGQLSSLRDLLIDCLPKVTSLPDSMTRLTGLAELVIKDCYPVAEVPELLEHFSELSEESKLGLREFMDELRGVQQRRPRRARCLCWSLGEEDAEDEEA